MLKNSPSRAWKSMAVNAPHHLIFRFPHLPSSSFNFFTQVSYINTWTLQNIRQLHQLACIAKKVHKAKTHTQTNQPTQKTQPSNQTKNTQTWITEACELQSVVLTLKMCGQRIRYAITCRWLQIAPSVISSRLLKLWQEGKVNKLQCISF